MIIKIENMSGRAFEKEEKKTFVKIPTPHSMAILAKNKSSARSRSLNPPNCINHRNTADFSISKNLSTITAGTLPAAIAAARSFGKLSVDLPASASTAIASALFFSRSSSSPPSCPSPPPPPPPPPSCPPGGIPPDEANATEIPRLRRRRGEWKRRDGAVQVRQVRM